MDNKVYKNKNMIRTNFSIKKFIRFMNNEERARFIHLYGEECKVWRCDKDNVIGLLINKEKFETIVKEIGLVRDKREESSRYYKSRAALD